MQVRMWHLQKVLTSAPRPSTIVPLGKEGFNLDWESAVDVVEDSSQFCRVQDLIEEHNALVRAYRELK